MIERTHLGYGMIEEVRQDAAPEPVSKIELPAPPPVLISRIEQARRRANGGT